MCKRSLIAGNDSPASVPPQSLTSGRSRKGHGTTSTLARGVAKVGLNPLAQILARRGGRGNSPAVYRSLQPGEDVAERRGRQKEVVDSGGELARSAGFAPATLG